MDFVFFFLNGLKFGITDESSEPLDYSLELSSSLELSLLEKLSSLPSLASFTFCLSYFTSVSGVSLLKMPMNPLKPGFPLRLSDESESILIITKMIIN